MCVLCLFVPDDQEMIGSQPLTPLLVLFGSSSELSRRSSLSHSILTTIDQPPLSTLTSTSSNGSNAPCFRIALKSLTGPASSASLCLGSTNGKAGEKEGRFFIFRGEPDPYRSRPFGCGHLGRLLFLLSFKCKQQQQQQQQRLHCVKHSSC